MISHFVFYQITLFILLFILLFMLIFILLFMLIFILLFMLVFIFQAKIDGHWGKWSAWSTCTKTCGDGMSTRSRTCNNPLPQNGGNPCVGAATDTSSCKAKSCFLGPSDCEFETGFCAWTNETSADQLNWILRSGSTPSVGTGPTGDHTSFGKGKIITFIHL